MPFTRMMTGALFGILLSIHSTASALPLQSDRPIFQVGDWSSSGTLEYPYWPTYKYEYECQAQISDNLDHGLYRYFAIADFKFDKPDTLIETSQLRFHLVKHYIYGKVEYVDGEIPFDVSGGSIFLKFRPVPAAPERDQVILDFFIEQNLDGIVISNRTEMTFNRRHERFVADVRIQARNADGTKLPNLMLGVICQKKR